MAIDERTGTVTDATDAAKPTVRLDGDTTGHPTLNRAVGYTPTNTDRVVVVVRDERRRLYITREVT
jgi:NADPH-dependent ferric siderophore reductase